MISVSEILMVFVVTLIAFGPKHLPGLLSTAGRLLKKFQDLREGLSQQWGQFLKEQQLLENQAKASEAEKHYQPSDES